MTLNALRAGCAVIAIFAASSAFAAAQCTSDVRVLAQPRDGLTLLEKYVDEFEELSGAGFEISYLNENDRRAKSQADASTVGSFNVYYVDEANLALFASSGWIVPLDGFYPSEYDYKDFDAGMRRAATYDGKQWFAPVQGGGDLMVYRTDLLEKAGIAPPKTWDEYFAAVQKLHDPANGVYGTALRGQRGSGANVWRWMPFFKANGGEWFKDGKPAFNSDAAVKATETYLEALQIFGAGHSDRLLGRVHRRLPLRQGGDHHRIRTPWRYVRRQGAEPGGRQGCFLRSTVAAAWGRLRPWLCNRVQGQQDR